MLAELDVERLRVERTVAAGGKARQLTEDDATGKVVEVDTDEIGAPGETLCQLDHLRQPRWARDGGRGPRVTTVEAQVGPAGGEEVLRAACEATAVDLHVATGSVEDEELVPGDR